MKIRQLHELREFEQPRSSFYSCLRLGLVLSLTFGTILSAASSAIADDEKSKAAYTIQNIAKGQTLVEKHCAKCHAIGRNDESSHKSAPAFRDVVTRYPAEHLAEALAEGIQTGHPDMPIFIFEAHQIGALIDYLNTLAPTSSTKQAE